MEHISFHSIEQFRHTVKCVRDRAKYHNVPLPILTFSGSVKLHGTNAAIGYDYSTDEMWCQSRTNIITVLNDNAKFTWFVKEREEIFRNFFQEIRSSFPSGKSKVVVFGEWCGEGIQKGVAINQVPKMFVIFDLCTLVYPSDERIWVPPNGLTEMWKRFNDGFELNRIFCVHNFETFSIEIDFNNPELLQNQLVELTNQVEQSCPVGKTFGVDGVGEGIVWRCTSNWLNGNGIITTSDLVFKVKGEKHSDTKVKKLASVDVERMQTISDFASSVVTDHRLEKMLELVKQDGLEIEPRSIPVFLKLVGQDIMKEESDTMEENGFERKEVMPVVSRLARNWFLELCQKVS